MITIHNNYFDIEQICESGQCFRFYRTAEGRYALTALGKYLELEQHGEEIRFFCGRTEFEEIWKTYFDLDTDYKKYMLAIPEKDRYLYSTVQFGKGIRILKQELWEVIIAFIISQQNNIKKIKLSVELMCEQFGERKETQSGQMYFAFPSAEALAEASEDSLRECKLGYRSMYIKKTAASILNGEVDLKQLKHLNYEDAKNELLKLTGIGTKVADCICLFGLHHLEAFPVDTHIKKVLDRQYPDGFPFEKYKGYEGIIQQYIFYYDLFGERQKSSTLR